MEAWKHLRAMTVVIPGVILWLTGLVGLPILGGALICLGLVLMVATIRLFVMVAKGTLAPWNPTQRLVVGGV